MLFETWAVLIGERTKYKNWIYCYSISIHSCWYIYLFCTHNLSGVDWLRGIFRPVRSAWHVAFVRNNIFRVFIQQNLLGCLTELSKLFNTSVHIFLGTSRREKCYRSFSQGPLRIPTINTFFVLANSFVFTTLRRNQIVSSRYCHTNDTITYFKSNLHSIPRIKDRDIRFNCLAWCKDVNRPVKVSLLVILLM